MNEAATGTGMAAQSLTPISKNERIGALDILRGLALFGILAVNVYGFGGYSSPSSPGTASLGLLDDLSYFIMEYVFSLKTFTLFSFLFGLGFAVQMARADKSGRPFAPFYARKLLILLGLGMAHHLLLWQGEILILYAALGFPLMLFRRARLSTIAAWFFVFLAIGSAIVAAGDLFMAMDDGSVFASAEYLEALKAAFGRGSFADTVLFRLDEFPDTMILLFGYQGPLAFAMFLAGLYAGRAGWLDKLSELPWLKTFAFACGASGVGFSVARYVLSGSPYASVMLPFANLGLTGFYASGAFLLARRPWFTRLCLPVAAAGRMALSNYVGQSILCCLLFCGYGLGLYSSLGPALLFACVMAVYALNLAISAPWLSLLRFGPLEWLWRSLSYGRAQPMLRPKS